MMKKILLSLILGLGLVHSACSADEVWNRHQARHFIVYYKSAPLDFVQSIADAAEEYYDEITRNLGFKRYNSWSYDNRAKIFVYDTREEYQKMAKSLHWSSGMANAWAKEIYTFPSAHGFFDSTLPHELGHIIFREFIGPVLVPLWLDEGVAMYQEKAKRWGANQYVSKAIEDGTFIPLSDLTKGRLRGDANDQKIIELFYAEAASIVYYMIVELGQARFESFCRKLSENVPFEDALTQTYGRIRDIDQLNDLWVRYLKDLK